MRPSRVAPTLTWRVAPTLTCTPGMSKVGGLNFTPNDLMEQAEAARSEESAGALHPEYGARAHMYSCTGD